MLPQHQAIVTDARRRSGNSKYRDAYKIARQSLWSGETKGLYSILEIEGRKRMYKPAASSNDTEHNA